MNMEQARQLRLNGQRIEVLERRIDAMCDLLTLFANRKPGRPTLTEMDEMERLQAQMRAGVH